MEPVSEQGHGSATRYDVIVIGAGPGGAEAALAAAGAGARTLCLSINLDSAGYHPANPTLAEGRDDPRMELLDELESLGGCLPSLLREKGVSTADATGRLLADRRELGLAYKHRLESADGLELRQALVTALGSKDPALLVETALDERFEAAAAVIAGGTFFDARITSGGNSMPGGRRGEIPSKSLAKSLQNAGFSFVRVTATASPRLASADAGDSFTVNHTLANLPADGSQLCERYGIGLEPAGSSDDQLSALRKETGIEDVWMNRPSYSVSHMVLASGQVDLQLRARRQPGILVAGRLAGCCNYVESAATGLIAGRNAAALVIEDAVAIDLDGQNRAMELCELIAESEARPVTIRTLGPGC